MAACRRDAAVGRALPPTPMRAIPTAAVHRALRDDHACRQKYGADWPKYCKLVRWRIIPFVY